MTDDTGFGSLDELLPRVPLFSDLKPKMMAALAGELGFKCDLCSGLPFEACVYNCPCGAISRVSPEELVG